MIDSTDAAKCPPSRRSPFTAALATLRPHQWVKNLFVAAPLVFSKHLFDSAYNLRSAAAVALFCAVSGAVYALNDVRDVDTDRDHPVKRNRPIAAGELSERSALLIAMGLAIVALMAGALISPFLALVLGGYLLNNLAYSLGLKHIAFLDVAMISGGFLLRVLGGALAISVPVSPFLFLCTGLLAGLLGFGKRAHELILSNNSDRSSSSSSSKDTTPAKKNRRSLTGYSRRGLILLLLILAVATCVAYAFYTQSERTVLLFQTRALIWTLPFCVIGIGRFLRMALASRDPRSPTELMLRDPLFIVNLGLWALTVFIIVYGERVW